MSKPILWLGPLEELDADFDPLLGRSARQAQPQSSFATPKPSFDPSRSVFDDPILDEAPAPAPAVIGPVLVPPLEPMLEPMSSELEPEPEVQVPPIAEPAFEPIEATDFTHNNDPIPTRQNIETTRHDVQSHAQEVPANEGPIHEAILPSAPKKSFFGSLFSLGTAPPKEAAIGASINDIWAKPEPEVDTAITSEPVEAPKLSGNIWDDIDKETNVEAGDKAHDQEPQFLGEIEADVDDQATEPQQESMSVIPDEEAPISLAESNVPSDASIPALDLESVPDSDDPETETSVIQAPDDQETEGQATEGQEINTQDPDNEELGKEPLLTHEPEAPVPVVAEQIVTPEPNSLYEPEPELVPSITVDARDDAKPTPPINFQKAFNADQFWALPSSLKPSQAEPIGFIDEPPTGELSPNAGPESITELIAEPLEPDSVMAPSLLEDVQPLGMDGDPLPLEPNQMPAAPTIAPKVRSATTGKATTGKRRKKKVKKTYVGAFFGTFLFGVALLMTLVSSLAAFGYPFDLMSGYRWYWVIMAIGAAGIWSLSRGWKMVIASFAVMGANLFVTVPASGKAPSGGKTATAVVGWANVAGNQNALERVFKDADKKKATLLMLAEAPQSVLSPPLGWTLIEAPAPGDPTAIAVLTKTTWRAATVPGEPTMARPPAGDLTVIGVHPQDAVKSRRRTPNRDALINRAGTRAGIQDGPTIVLGDFNAAPWDGAMRQFRTYGNVTRVRCGGWAGTTLTQTFGLIGVATDHAYVRDVKVTHCQLGASLIGGNHKPIWLYVAPQPAPPSTDPKP